MLSPSVVSTSGGIAARQLVVQEVDEVGRGVAAAADGRDAERLRGGAGVLLGRDLAGLQQQVEDRIAALEGALRVRYGE